MAQNFNRQSGDKDEFPAPNVVVPTNDVKHLTEDSVRGILCNPIYTGVEPFPQIIQDEEWIRGAEKLIKEEGARQFLVNVLHCLKVTYHRHFEAEKEGG